MTPTYSHYGGFAEGDHVTRDGTDVHLVKDMTDDGYSATFVCVVAPASGWASVGEEELNLCRRYERVKHNKATWEWEPDPGFRCFHVCDPFETINNKIEALNEAFCVYLDALIKSGLRRSIWQAYLQATPAHRHRYHRHPKRRALRK